MKHAWRSTIALTALLCVLAATSCGSSDDASSDEEAVRGFDGTTVTVAGLGPLAFYAGADVGAQARFKRANDTDEIPGVRIEFAEFADDKQDPATASSEVKRLVTQVKAFAIVPDFSGLNPGPYLTAQKVPYVGFALDNTICSDEPTTELWGFGFNGCLVPKKPKVMPDFFSGLRAYVTEQTGEERPTVAVAANDTDAGKTATAAYSSAADGAGFEVVYHKANVPTVTSDFSPYVQEWTRADGGDPPDTFLCFLGAAQCISAWPALKAAGFDGTFYTAFGVVEPLAKPLAGTVTQTNYNVDPNPGLDQLARDLEAFEPGTKPVSYSNVPGYFAADKFVKALKEVGAENITPDAVQQALATQKWEIEGLVGPFNYPESTVAPTPNCTALIKVNDDGSGFTTIDPYRCSKKRHQVRSTFSG